MSNKKRIDKILKKIDQVVENPTRYRCPDLIVSGLNCLVLNLQLGEL